MKKELHLLQEILGSKNYLDFLAYTEDILSCCLKIKQEYGDFYFLVGITRRCFVLFRNLINEIFQNKNLQFEEEAYFQKIKALFLKLSDMDQTGDPEQAYKKFVKKHYITDTALLSMVGRLTDLYMERSSFPQLVVLDELLIHGRGLNGFLFSMEEGLLKEYRQRILDSDVVSEDVNAALEALRNTFVQGLYLRVFAANNEDQQLLLRRYRDRMSYVQKCTHSEWRQLSLRFGQVVSIGTTSNVGFSWVLHHTGSPWKPNENLYSGDFRAVTTHLQDIEQKTYTWFYPNEKRPKLAGTVRFKRNAEKQLICVPYFMSGTLRWNDVWRVHEHLCKIAEEQKKYKLVEFLSQNDRYIKEQNQNLYVRWIAETNELVLSSLLMKKFAAEVGHCEMWDEYKAEFGEKNNFIQYGQILPNYRLHFTNGMEDVADTAVREIWTLETSLEGLLIELTGSAEPFATGAFLLEWDEITASKENDLPIDDPIVFAVEDTVASIGTRAETNAFTRYTGNVIFNDYELSHWGKNYSLEITLQEFQTILQNYRADLKKMPNLYQFISILTQAMDLGLLGMSNAVQIPEEAQRSDAAALPMVVYTRQRAGEAALFILPTRYRYFLKELDNILEKYQSLKSLRNQEIKFLVDTLPPKREVPKALWQLRPHNSVEVMENRLEWFVDLILSSGQTFKEWNIRLDDVAKQYKYSLRNVKNKN